MDDPNRKVCRICRTAFDPRETGSDPAQEMGRFLAREEFGDVDHLCGACLASRGRLGMMYLRDRD